MRVFFVIISLCLVLGLANAAYVFVEKSGGGTVACYVVDGCDRVLSSPYANLFGVPLYGWGIAYYACGLVLLFLYHRKKISLRAFLMYMLVGTMASMVFLYVQAFVLFAFCLSCLVSALLIFYITIHTFLYFRRSRSIS